MSDAPLEIEETDLKAHVQICAQRNKEVAKALAEIKRIQWGILGALALSGIIPWDKIVPLVRAMPGVP